MQKIAVLVIVSFFCMNSIAQSEDKNRCENVGGIAGAAVQIKYATGEIPKEFKRSQFIAYAVSEDLEKLGFNIEQVKSLAAQIDAAKGYPSVKHETLGASYYFQGVCESGKSLSEVPLFQNKTKEIMACINKNEGSICITRIL